jgi:hypothetical protein
VGHMSDREGHRILAYCCGFTVEAADGVVGEVETPLFPPDAAVPDFLIVRTSGRVRVRRPIVATGLVERIDLTRKVIVLRGSEREIKGLPEHLPLAI